MSDDWNPPQPDDEVCRWEVTAAFPSDSRLPNADEIEVAVQNALRDRGFACVIEVNSIA